MNSQSEKFGIAITTYENNNNKVLTHIFWGDTLQAAFGIAKSHLITDYFFSSSFEGQMRWGAEVLKLSNKGQILPYTDDVTTPQLIIEDLTNFAREINRSKGAEEIPEILNEIKDDI